MNELTKAWECVPRRGIPKSFPAATLLPLAYTHNNTKAYHIYFPFIYKNKQERSKTPIAYLVASKPPR